MRPTNNRIRWIQLILCILINYVARLMSSTAATNHANHHHHQQATSIESWSPGAREVSHWGEPTDGDNQQTNSNNHNDHQGAVISPSRHHERHRRRRHHDNEKQAVERNNQRRSYGGGGHHQQNNDYDDDKQQTKTTTLDELADDIVVESTTSYNDNVVPIDEANDDDHRGHQLAWLDESANEKEDEHEAEANKTNPLIESEPVAGRLYSQVVVPYAERQYLSENEHHHHDDDGDDESQVVLKQRRQQQNKNNNAKNIKPLQSGQSDHHGGAERSRLETIHSGQVGGFGQQQPLVGETKHKGPEEWCHMNCNINDGQHRQQLNEHGGRHHHRHHHHQDRSKIICASDGRFYESMCELRRFACLNNVHLFKRPIWQCSTRSQTINYNEAESKLKLKLAQPRGANRNDGEPATSNDASRLPTISPPPSSSLPSGAATTTTNDNNNSNNNSHNNNGSREPNNNSAGHQQLQDDKVRFIELKRHCNRSELEDFKAALLDEFGGQIEPMFRYFDTNNDGYIEAHELWPRIGSTTADGGSNPGDNNNASESRGQSTRSKYYEDHSGPECQSTSSQGHHYHYAGSRPGCWSIRDFAFEPRYSWSPCSLSHLILFQSAGSNYKFDLATFEGAFLSTRLVGPRADQLKNQSTIAEEILKETHLTLTLGQSKLLDCLPASIRWHNYNNINNNGTLDGGDNNLVDPIDKDDDGDNGDENDDTNNDNLMQELQCQWTRYTWPLGWVRDPHVSIEGADRISPNLSDSSAPNSANPRLFLREAQLYLSGQYKCTCTLANRPAKSISHLYRIQVLAEPKVIVRPSHQWSLANSKASFECQHDFIDTRLGSSSPSVYGSQAGLKINWLKDNQEMVVDSKIYTDNSANETTTSPNTQPLFQVLPVASKQHFKISPTSGRASISMASTKLAVEPLQRNDTGEFVCRVQVPIEDSEDSSDFGAESGGSLLVQDQAKAFEQPTVLDAAQIHQGNGDESETYLWMFHDNGISVFKVQSDGGQEMELLREINGHSLVSPEVDGNWNQLTLCGGLNQEQVVICEWSDNALYVNVPLSSGSLNSNNSHNNNNNSNNSNNNEGNKKIKSRGQKARGEQKYIYVGQPNLNRVIVMDGLKFEIVAIINTEPQPRKLFPARPNKIHLSKWVRRRLSPIANARWLAAIGSHAHELQLTPANSQLNSARPSQGRGGAGQSSRWSGGAAELDKEDGVSRFVKRQTAIRHTSEWMKPATRAELPPGTTRLPSKLIQHDIWLLCYGQPLVVSPGLDDDHLDEAPAPATDGSSFGGGISPIKLANESGSPTVMNLISDKPATSREASGSSGTVTPTGAANSLPPSSVRPFTPRLSHSGRGWPMAGWPTGSVTAREARLRNRKSVQIIQSTFFPRFLADDVSDTHHGHQQVDSATNSIDLDSANGTNQSEQPQQWQREIFGERERKKTSDITTVGKFKRVTVLTTHYVFAGTISGSQMMAGSERRGTSRTSSPSGAQQHQRQRYQLNQAAPFDLIQELTVPMKPYPLMEDARCKQHHAYVSHYDEQRLYRVSMDEYRYDRQVDLQNCDPINLVSAAQGLLIIQCRARIAHNLIGQLVLDELTTTRLQFNENIRAQEAYLSPDNRYLVSIYTNTSAAAQPASASGDQKDPKFQQQRRQSIIYVQSVSVEGLKLQYEIKTWLDISQCSFVWKEGYYAAIFVSTNRQEQQSEVLSLRLADGRLELMVRVAGLISTSRHKEVLNVLAGLQMAALSTNQATYLIDMEENRVIQTLHHRQSTPTLLWVH